jgi:hypothetical protein
MQPISTPKGTNSDMPPLADAGIELPTAAPQAFRGPTALLLRPRELGWSIMLGASAHSSRVHIPAAAAAVRYGRRQS